MKQEQADFKPKDLNEAIQYLLSQISTSEESTKTLEDFVDDERGFIVELHFNSGMSMRNSWNLWWYENHGYEGWPTDKPEIVKYFNDELDIYHADDMSGIIMTSLFRTYFNAPLDLPQQVKRYHDHWLKYSGNINPMLDSAK